MGGGCQNNLAYFYLFSIYHFSLFLSVNKYFCRVLWVVWKKGQLAFLLGASLSRVPVVDIYIDVLFNTYFSIPKISQFFQIFQKFRFNVILRPWGRKKFIRQYLATTIPVGNAQLNSKPPWSSVCRTMILPQMYGNKNIMYKNVHAQWRK